MEHADYERVISALNIAVRALSKQRSRLLGIDVVEANRSGDGRWWLTLVDSIGRQQTVSVPYRLDRPLDTISQLERYLPALFPI